MENIGIGLIGAGVMGADHANTIAQVAGGRLVAVQDFDAARAAALAARWGARVMTTAEELIADPAVDAVMVCAPDNTHAPLALRAITVQKPVLVEKPLAGNAAAARTVVEAEMEAGHRLVQVGFMRRFDPGYRDMRATLASGRLGAALFFHCIHRNAVGPDYLTSELVIGNSAIHEIDIARFVLGEDIVAATVVSPRASRRAPNRQAQLIVLETQSGVVVDIEAFMDAGYGYDVQGELVCEDGTVSLQPHPAIRFREAARDGHAVEQDWRARFRDAYREQMAAWLTAIRTGVPTGSSAWDGYVATMTADTCLEAWRAQKRVAFTPMERPAFYAD